MVTIIYEDGSPFFLKKGDFVDLDFGVSGIVHAAEIVAIKQTSSDKVLVDVDVTLSYGNTKKEKTRLHGIHSMCCRVRDEAYLKELEKKDDEEKIPFYSEAKLIQFGNFLLEGNQGRREVTDVDLANWKATSIVTEKCNEITFNDLDLATESLSERWKQEREEWVGHAESTHFEGYLVSKIMQLEKEK